MLEKRKLGKSHGSLELETDGLSKMDNLMLLQLNFVHLRGSYKDFPDKLRWLCLHGFPLKSIPSDLPMKNLVALDMSYSKIESFGMFYSDLQQLGSRQNMITSSSKNDKLLGSLKILDLSYCYQLCTLGGFYELPSLERLIVIQCISLQEISDSIEWCDELVFIDMSYCQNVEKLLRPLRKLHNVKRLLLDGCISGESQIKEMDIDSLGRFNVKNMDINSQTSSIGSSSLSTHDYRYDVYLCSGSDTRFSFTDQLHKALINENLDTFLGNSEIHTGEAESAIKASRISVIVLSRDYPSQTWQLEELVLILEQHRRFGQFVIPIFYHVERNDVSKQLNSFGDAMANHEQMMEAETDEDERRIWAQRIELWKKELAIVAGLKGKEANDRLETVIVHEVISDIKRQLGVDSRIPSPDFIGQGYNVRFISSWLIDKSTHTTEILTIEGMDGIGKTSLARHIYDMHSRLFQRSIFIEDINRKWQELQKKFCSDISKITSIQEDDISLYSSTIEKAFASKKFFLVLDDVHSPDQLDALLGHEGFHPGSKIIITTTNLSLTERCALFKQNHTKWLLNGLNETSSLQLLRFHAFNILPEEGYKLIKPGHKLVSEKLAKLCKGHPLALKVVGRCLRDRDVTKWEEYIEKLEEEETDFVIQKALRISFDSLPSQNDKELFKHIACFFVGMDKDYTETIMKACGIRIVLGIKNLIDRHLLTSGQNQFMMHQLVQEMGRDVVRQESPNKPWERSRLWSDEESFMVLKQEKGKENTLGLNLDIRKLEKKKLNYGSLELETDEFSKMENLMLLQLNYVRPLNGSYENFTEELRWLCMHGFPLESIPLDLPMKNLVALDMSYSNITSFDMHYSNLQRPTNRKRSFVSFSKEKTLLGSLKILNLSFSYRLCSLGDFSRIPKLERLILTSCTSLVEISDTIDKCNELVLVDLTYCYKLKKLPGSIGMSKKIETLLLDGCNFDES
ncbi:disease resistance protein RPV1-like isoform X2 [Rutidosis leptorrhynchoides]|uniref:disease resistance protein RPV1-like isoform X2 n=1 Tax=Rutidosis leptorrhynchoides TaxID=125765 RepID=UPI003A99DEC9